ncbi:E3 ubiquitin-protein ligase UPL3-like isoform X2 [Nicotiana tomentosiformis]|uniref:E3 ubiquitin-protein ligase UPL3-like isoform X2 n=1 Tax=Nicotiana tomentosiformis TaxID=4098 RepID=UPI00388C83C5
METRSRKLTEEATSSAPSSSYSTSSGPTTRVTKPARLTTRAPSTRSRVTKRSLPMDSTNETSGSGSRARRSGSGKEKEHEIRDRDDEDDNDNESENDVGILHHNLTSTSSALQGLLRKLGAGLDDLLPSSAMVGSASSSSNGRLKKILSGLRADGEEGKQIEALTQLCVMLSIGTEDSLSTFSVDSFVPVLVGLLNNHGGSSNPDIMLLAARALTHLVDVLPSSCAAVVHYGAVSCFVARLLTIEYMDLAEQSLQALKKISQEDPTACLRAGALMAVLSYLDFFSTGVQRVALATAANMCKKLPSDAADFVMEAVPLLTNLLQYHDAKVLEHASICLTRIAEAFATSPEKLDELCNHGLVTQAASLISTSNSGGGQASLSTETYTGLIRLLSTSASGSPLGAKTLMILGISRILKDILSGSGLVATVSISPALSRPPEQIFEIVNLANELLPPLPQGTISLPVSTNLFIRGSFTRKPSASGSVKQEDLNASSQEVSAREKLLNDQPELLQQFGTDLLPVLIQTYGSSVNTAARHKCLSVIGKLMYFSNADMIQSLIDVTNVSSFLAGVLAWKDPQVLVPALQIAEILMQKLPGVFGKMFVREGVVHAVDTLILTESHGSATTQPTRGEKEKCNRRCSTNSHTDATSVEDPKSPVPSIGSPPDPMEIPTVNSNPRMAVSSCAKSFKDKYFPSDSEATEAGATDDLLQLKNLCMKLNAGIDDQIAKPKGKSKTFGPQLGDISICKEETLAEVIAAMLGELSKGDGVSTFEFIGSGVVASLLNYFTCGHLSKEKISNASLPRLREQAIKRYKSFIAVALPAGVDGGSVVPMTVLVQKLQNALCSLERFPVVLSHSSRSSTGNARLSSGLSALSQPFKLRLCRAQGEKTLRDYSSNVLLIDPLASLVAIEGFLWPRVKRPESGQKASASSGNSGSGTIPAGGGASYPSMSTPASAPHRHSTRSRSAVNINDSAKGSLQEKDGSSSKGKGKAVMKPAQGDGREPQTKNAARRKAALDKDTEVKPVNGDSSSEMLRDDSLPVCLQDEVHDVKLVDSSEDSPLAQTPSDSHTNAGGGSRSRTSAGGSDSIEFRSRNSYSSRGAMSFAAAAMAGLSSASGRGVRDARDQHGRPLFGSGDPPKLIFSVGGKLLNRHLTVYQAIQRQLVLDEDDDERDDGNDFASSDGSRVWSDIYTITYQRAESQVERLMNGAGSLISSKSTKASSLESSSVDPSLLQASLLDSILQGELPCDLEKSNPTYSILYLLRVLEALNQLAPRLRVLSLIDDYAEGKVSSLDEVNTTVVKIPYEEFVNSKLTPKLARQIQDALALCSGSLPSWCYQLTKACPFLFPFETRRQFFYSTAFGLSRALNRLQQQQGAEGNGSTHERAVRVGRLQRQKVRVSRNRILDSAAKVMEMYSSQKAVLEVEYFGEVGTGLGPTLEFYTLLSHDLQKVGLGMWRSGSSSTSNGHSMEVCVDNKLSGSDKDLVRAPLGLFPRPWPPHADTVNGGQFCKVIEHFRLLGRVMAKALQDGRLMDLPLSTAFYKLVLGQELDLYDILSFDAELGKTLQELQALVSRKQYIESMEDQNQDKFYDVHFHGTPIEDLCLDFTLPGYPEYVFKACDENVDLSNLEEYISLVVDATVRSGIRKQTEAFRSGFNQVFEISTLQIFSATELDYLLCGRRELWKPETLVDHIKFDHGYTAKSPPIIHLLEIMGEFTPEQQRAFCQFVTGAPRLPPGGLTGLNPKLTIVRKHSSTAGNAAHNTNAPSESADEDLPSVMTCANYLKLPPYSSKEIMYKKLLYAINEGQGSFDLS